MTEKAAEKIERLRDRIKESDEISNADREVLLAFSDRLYLLSSRYSDHRHEHLLRRCTRMAEKVGGLADALEERDATEELVRWIHQTYDNEETNRDYRGSLRVFAKHVSDGDDDLPESVDWVPGSTSRNYKPAPKPGDMLHWEVDILEMVDAARYSRDKAMIAVAWDAGARSGEFRDLQIGDVSDHDRGLQITVDGKTGQRTITLIPSVPYLQRWLEDHPGGASDDPLWSKLHSPGGISYNMYRKILETAAEDADVEKPVTLTNFRKSSASYLASQGVNQAVLEEHHGWARGSRVASRYVSVFADATDREIAAAHGVDVEREEPDPTGPVPCPRCGKDTPRSEDFCMWCHQALEHGALDEIQEDQQRKRTELFRFAKENPEFIDRVSEFEPVIEMFDGDPELIELAERFVDETN